MSDVFEKRIRRAMVLVESWPHAGEILAFFRSVTRLQQNLRQRLDQVSPRDPEGHDLFLVQPFLASAVQLLRSDGPSELASRAGELESRPYSEWLDFLTMTRAGLDGTVQSGDPMDDPAGSLRAGVLMTETTIELLLIISIVALVCAVLGPIVLFVL